jgi:hypothetical protein
LVEKAEKGANENKLLECRRELYKGTKKNKHKKKLEN